MVTEAFGRSAGMKIHDSWIGEFIFFSVALACVLGLGYWLREKEPALSPAQAV